MIDLFRKFNELNILIIGDVMMDSYLWGNVDRISPEAPVPVVSVHKRENRLGGAANVALNIQSLGATPLICSVIGNDMEGAAFLRLLEDHELSAEGIISLNDRPTTVKTRVIGQNQQMLRIDEETDALLSQEHSGQLIDKIKTLINSKEIHAIIFQDYDKGVISHQLIIEIVEESKRKNIITVVDPKKRNFLKYANVTLFKPNLKELREGLKVEIDMRQMKDLESAVEQIKGHLNAEHIMVTLSELGVFMQSNDQKRLIPAHIRKIADVSGAGDTVIATAAVCLASGLDVFTTAAVSNLAGGLVCEHVGVVSIDKEHLLNESLKLK
ncbi:bifunctional heptose 7-phosphate kinase/heptose 1-phosphate adenyltransferase [Arcticibacter eurypsychrophilus]|uniref:bifunctional heptose 7-phosphate kinase/heptose 1-phosphate adenyltransferase n=1 Tax=Arcticibacter eurypsychrophilus TaxID=1434752 RepID=UPI00084D2D7C|nr:bifunctional ADP-heptose synthase [Arcticibacter eurypsychrophilus]